MMAKGNRKEVRISRGDSPEASEADRHSLAESDGAEDDENEEGEPERRSRKEGRRGGEDNDDELELDDKVEREREDSVTIAIEDDDVDRGRRSQKQSNTYAAKKTVAQGMMDIALITANANQLRYIIEFNRHSSTFFVNVFPIVVSLLLQVGVGLSLIFKGRLDLRGESKHRNAKRINNYVVVGVFLVTIINVFIASFTVTGGGDGSLHHRHHDDIKI